MIISPYMYMIRYVNNGSLISMVNGRYSVVFLNLLKTSQVLALVN
nr:MAG TPA: hypothetical protein [Caudoviricetes sp.]